MNRSPSNPPLQQRVASHRGKRWSRGTLFTLRAIGGLVAALLFGAAIWVFGPLDEVRAGAFDRGHNGIWMRRHYLHGGADPSDLARMGTAFAELGIDRIYPFLGPMDPSGWPGWRQQGRIQRYDPATVEAFFKQVRTHHPELKVLPWTGGVLHRDVRLNDPKQRAAFVQHARQLVKLGASGIHLNIEPMPTGEPGYLDLLRELDAALGTATLSIAAYPPPTLLHRYERVHWDLPFLRQVCEAADELVVMAYDTALSRGPVFEALVADWTETVIATLPPPSEGGCRLLMGVPAYDDDVGWHRPGAETLAHGLRGVMRGLSRAEVPPHFDGVSIYASWTMDPQKWATYQTLWRNEQPPAQPPPR